jgi:hypothetical protein
VSADYRTALSTAIKEYEALGQQRREIDDRLAQLAHTIGTLNRLLGLVPTVPIGLTDACRLALRGAGLPLTPLDVRDRLQSIGVDLSVYTNELSAIHTILKRLNDAGEVRVVTKTGKPAFVWNHTVESVGVKDQAEAIARFNALAPPVPARRKRKGRA